MSSDGYLYDLGYQAYDGERLGRAGPRLAIARDGMRKVLGLRRRARTKFLPWGLFLIGLFPAVVFIGIGVIGGQFGAEEDTIFSHPDYFELSGPIALIFIALASAELLIPDRVEGTIQVYASRPLTTADYLGAKAGALVALVAGFMMFPQLLLWLGLGGLSSDGFAGYLGTHIDDLAKAALATLVYLAAYLPIAFAVASLATRTSIAAGAFAAAFFASSPITAGIVDAGGLDSIGLLALDHHPRYVRDWIFGVDTHEWIPERAGFEPIISLLAILVVAAVSLLVVARRYRNLR
jgi:ABC-2 type transport system permease protein